MDPAHLEMIRLAMLEALGERGELQAATLERRIRYSANLERLWYLRSDLMGEVGAARGEVAARQILAEITELFQEGPRGEPRLASEAKPDAPCSQQASTPVDPCGSNGAASA